MGAVESSLTSRTFARKIGRSASAQLCSHLDEGGLVDCREREARRCCHRVGHFWEPDLFRRCHHLGHCIDLAFELVAALLEGCDDEPRLAWEGLPSRMQPPLCWWDLNGLPCRSRRLNRSTESLQERRWNDSRLGDTLLDETLSKVPHTGE